MPGRSPKPQIVFIDDEQRILDLYRMMLRVHADEWQLDGFVDSRAALEFIQRNQVDAIISDVNMPHLNGLELLEQLRSDPSTCDIPVTMLTGSHDSGLKRHGLDLGATDLLNKPVSGPDLVARVRSMLRLKFAEDELKRRNQNLEKIVEQRTTQLRRSRLQIITRLGKAAEFRDEETGEHVMRVGYCSRVLAETMGLPESFLKHLFLAATLHDVGKIGIPDAILLKPGRLTDQEREVMQTHCVLGERILREPCLTESLCDREFVDSLEQLSVDDVLLELAGQIALSHHERWDGQGYPQGLRQSEIPLPARIVAVADVYDALTSVRPYKDALPHADAVKIIENGSGTQFDPSVVEAFLKSQTRMAEARQVVTRALCHVGNVDACKREVEHPLPFQSSEPPQAVTLGLSPHESDKLFINDLSKASPKSWSTDELGQSSKPLVLENSSVFNGLDELLSEIADDDQRIVCSSDLRS